MAMITAVPAANANPFIRGLLAANPIRAAAAVCGLDDRVNRSIVMPEPGELASLASLRGRTLLHLARGIVGLLAVVLAFDLAPSHPVTAIACAAAALASFRGCPMCWMI